MSDTELLQHITAAFDELSTGEVCLCVWHGFS